MPTIRIESWDLVEPGAPLARAERSVDPDALDPSEVLIEVAACGVCHTDLGFVYEGVRTRHPLPLTLGHEIAGRVVHAGADFPHLVGEAVIVPAVIPCGRCAACEAGRGAVCREQVFPGNDAHGGFASHVRVPGRGLCVVPREALDRGELDLVDLAVIADAVTTPYQAIVNASLARGDLAVVVGAGGVGSFAVQIARALGAVVVAIDVDPARLERATSHGAALAIHAREDARAIRAQIGRLASENGIGPSGWKIFECSGSVAGQELAFSLLGPDAHLGVVGYTREKVSLRLSNLMAFDATARGTWGCLPALYPAALELVRTGGVVLAPFVERRPMSRIQETFEALRAHALTRRPVLVPDF